MKKHLTALLLVIVLCPFSYSAISMTPYLQALTSNSVFVCVECSTADTVTVNYGLTGGFGSSAKSLFIVPTSGGSTYIHRINLVNLTANTIYFYQAVQGSSSSPVTSFRSGVLPGTGYRFCVMGDCRSNPTTHGQIATAMLGMNPLFSIYSGDYCIDDSYSSWKSQYFVTEELNLISRVPFFSTSGNHENWGPNNQAFFFSPPSTSGTPDYYSFDAGDVHFVSINNSVSYTVGSPQYNWAMNDLTMTNKRWKIVYFHEPAYSSGGHGSNATMQSWYTNIFIPKGVDMVFCGHNHFYQHCLSGGLHEFVIGGGGAPLYVPTSASFVVKSAQSYCYGVFDVTSAAIQMTIYSNTNSVIDTLTLSKPLGIQGNTDPGAASYRLYQNYPNPFNPATRIKFDVPAKNNSNVNITVYDISGKAAATLVNERLNAGTYEVFFDGSRLSSGTYFCKLTADNFSDVKKITLIK
ncbi:MAG: metallophosphoesterase [Bacteroidetes bacterium]|nr:metallophosphoesterase [Bacteroidota bacterium]